MKFIKKTSGMLGAATITLASLLLVSPVMAQNDPPGRVARVGYSYGQISFADAGSNQWAELIPNRPISIGDSIFVAEQGRAELHVGNSAIRLNENTRLSFINLTDDVSQIQLTQGTVVVRVRALSEREVFEINTPNLNFSVQEPGEYRININPDNTTTVIVRRGVGVAQGDRDVITLREGEQTRFSGTNLNHTMIARAPAFDTFDQWAYDRDRAEENSVSARYVPRDMVGYQQLDEYGNWETHVEYGAIWYPRGISSGWAPYRDGRWVWVAPWGWTWVDRSPWGFAPYHYGRWAYVGHRWGWVPGRYEHHHRPVYAPALVAFVGATNHGVSLGVSVGTRHVNGPAVSWYPLGPGESYRPHYTQNPRYIQNINQTVINNTVVIDRGNRGKNIYVNRDIPNSVTSVPSQTFVRGEHVFPASKSILANQIKKLEVLNDGPNLSPANNNRFGEARPRTWQENDQYRSRATINNDVQTNVVPNYEPRNRDRDRDRSNQNNGNVVHYGNQNGNNAGQSGVRLNSNNLGPNNVGIGQTTAPNTGAASNTAAPANAIVQYPQRPDVRTESRQDQNNRTVTTPNTVNGNAVNINNAQGNVKSYDEIQAERGRQNRFDDANRGTINNSRFDNRREAPVQNTITTAPATLPATVTPNIVPSPMPARPVELAIERPIERPMERPQERLIERGNDRPIERPQATFAPRPEIRQEQRPVEVKREMPTAAPVSIPTPSPAAAKVDRAEKIEKARDKQEDAKNKRER